MENISFDQFPESQPVPGPADHLYDVSTALSDKILPTWGHALATEGLGNPAPGLWLRRDAAVPHQVQHRDGWKVCGWI